MPLDVEERAAAAIPGAAFQSAVPSQNGHAVTNDLVLTITGNLTADPELNRSRGGTPFATLIVATTPRHYDRAADIWADEETIYLRCTAWRHTAENIATSLRKGDRVLAHGKLRQHTHTTDTGSRSAFELEIDDIGPSLRHRTAQTGPGSQHTADAAPSPPVRT